MPEQISLFNADPNNADPNPCLIPNQDIESLVSYVQYLADNKTLYNERSAKFNSSLLLDSHKNRSVFLVDKYVKCAIPSISLEFLLESQGISEYHACLDGYKHSICSNENEVSEVFSPNIYGDHFNPYIRFKSTSAVASRTCGKLLDLAGLEIANISEVDPHDNVFLDIVCTFPSEVDLLLINGKYRSKACYKISKNGKPTSQLNIKKFNLIDRMNRCRYNFFQSLNNLLTYGDSEQILGCSSSLHVWSSAAPVLPNAHVHNLIPFFSYKRNIIRIPELLDLDPDLLSSVAMVETRYIRSTGNGKINYSDKVLQEKYIVDPEKYKQLRLILSNRLRDQLGFTPCVWRESNFPIDIDLFKKLWSDCVRSEFKELDLDPSALFDIHVQFIPWFHKSKLLHALQYKSRPPVLDLELFFQKLRSDLVDNYDSLDLEVVSDYFMYNLQVAINCSNTPDINRFESYIVKFNKMVEQYSESDIFEWLQFLSIWVTDTRVYGFWRNIKRYMLDPEHEILVEQKICPICNGQISSIRRVDYCIVDSIIVRSRSKFLVYDLGDPGG